jgi:hypothetical protein
MATPKKPTPKVKITGSASGRAATGTKSVTRGASMAQNAKIVDRKSAAKVTKVAKGPTIAGPAPKINKNVTKESMRYQAQATAQKKIDKQNKEKADAKKLDAAMKRGAASRKAIANKVVNKINQTAKYTPAGIVGRGAFQAGKVARKIANKIDNK